MSTSWNSFPATRDGGKRTLKQGVKKKMGRVANALRGPVGTLQGILEAITCILACGVFFPLGLISHKFDRNCLLNSDVYLRKSSKGLYTIDMLKTKYPDDDDCNYTTFINVIVAIHSLIWLWFFNSTNGLRRPNGSVINLLLPALVCRLIVLLFVIVSSIEIANGFTVWCDNMTHNARKYGTFSCKEMQDLPWEREKSMFYTYSAVAVGCSWLLAVSLIVSCAMTLLHLYQDFLHSMAPQLKALANDYQPLEGEDHSECEVEAETPVDSQEVVVDFHKEDDPPNEVDTRQRNTPRPSQ